MRLDLGAEGDLLAGGVDDGHVSRGEPLDDRPAARAKGEERALVQHLDGEAGCRALDVLANLANVLAGLSGRLDIGGSGREVLAHGDVGRYDVACAVVGTAARASAVVALGVETAAVALVVLGVGALDRLEHEHLVTLVAAGEVPVVADAVGATRLGNALKVGNIGYVVASREEGEVAVLAAA